MGTPDPPARSPDHLFRRRHHRLHRPSRGPARHQGVVAGSAARHHHAQSCSGRQSGSGRPPICTWGPVGKRVERRRRQATTMGGGGGTGAPHTRPHAHRWHILVFAFSAVPRNPTRLGDSAVCALPRPPVAPPAPPRPPMGMAACQSCCKTTQACRGARRLWGLFFPHSRRAYAAQKRRGNVSRGGKSARKRLGCRRRALCPSPCGGGPLCLCRREELGTLRATCPAR